MFTFRVARLPRLNSAVLITALPLAILLAVPAARAQEIERSAFSDAAVTDTFTGLGLPIVNSGFVSRNGITYTFSTGGYRYNDFGRYTTGEGLATDAETASMTMVLADAYQRVGLDIGGSAGTVQFYDVNDVLLSTQTISSAAETGFDFVGFESAGGIKRVVMTDTSVNRIIQMYDNVTREGIVTTAAAAPEPGSLVLLLTAGIPLVGIVRRRAQR